MAELNVLFYLRFTGHTTKVFFENVGIEKHLTWNLKVNLWRMTQLLLWAYVNIVFVFSQACKMFFTTLYAYLWMLWRILPVSTIIWCMIPAGTVHISVDMLWRWCTFFHPLFDWTELSLFFFVMLRTIMRRYLCTKITCKLFTLLTLTPFFHVNAFFT